MMVRLYECGIGIILLGEKMGALLHYRRLLVDMLNVAWFALTNSCVHDWT